MPKGSLPLKSAAQRCSYRSVYALGSSRYPAARGDDRCRIAVVLATDFNPGSSPTPSMPMILSLASTQLKMTPAESVTASTINAAYTLSHGEKIGSLEPGKLADFVIHDCEDYRESRLLFWDRTCLESIRSWPCLWERRTSGGNSLIASGEQSRITLSSCLPSTAQDFN